MTRIGDGTWSWSMPPGTFSAVSSLACGAGSVFVPPCLPLRSHGLLLRVAPWRLGVSSGSLFAYARKHKYLVEKEAQEVFRQVCRGVAAMHHANACHRDIKVGWPWPAVVGCHALSLISHGDAGDQMENILFGDDKLLKLADFGLAVLLAEPEKKLNDICGSLLYVRLRVPLPFCFLFSCFVLFVFVCFLEVRRK